jgi:hypothetical protein
MSTDFYRGFDLEIGLEGTKRRFFNVVHSIIMIEPPSAGENQATQKNSDYLNIIIPSYFTLVRNLISFQEDLHRGELTSSGRPLLLAKQEIGEGISVNRS